MAYSLNEWLPFMQIDISVLGCVCGEWVCDGGVVMDAERGGVGWVF